MPNSTTYPGLMSINPNWGDDALANFFGTQASVNGADPSEHSLYVMSSGPENLFEGFHSQAEDIDSEAVAKSLGNPMFSPIVMTSKGPQTPEQMKEGTTNNSFWGQKLADAFFGDLKKTFFNKQTALYVGAFLIGIVLVYIGSQKIVQEEVGSLIPEPLRVKVEH